MDVESAIVARASTDHQGDAVDHQVLALMEWAKKLSRKESGERFVIRQHHVYRDDGACLLVCGLFGGPVIHHGRDPGEWLQLLHLCPGPQQDCIPMQPDRSVCKVTTV